MPLTAQDDPPLRSLSAEDAGFYFESIQAGFFIGDDRVALLDWGAQRVVVLDIAGGGYSIGGRGQGPGEFQRPADAFLRGDTLFVSEFGGRLTAFTLDGAVVETKAPQVELSPTLAWWRQMRGGAVVAHEAATGGVGWPPPLPRSSLVLVSAAGSRTVKQGEAGVAMVRVAGEVHPVPAVAPQELHLLVLADSAAIVVDGYQGKATLYTVGVGGQFAVSRDIPLPVTGRAVQAADLGAMRRAALEFRGEERPLRDVEVVPPTTISLIEQAGTDSSGRIWLHVAGNGETPSRLMLQMPDDSWQETAIPSDFNPLAVRDSAVLGYCVDDFGVQTVAILRIARNQP